MLFFLFPEDSPVFWMVMLYTCLPLPPRLLTRHRALYEKRWDGRLEQTEGSSLRVLFIYKAPLQRKVTSALTSSSSTCTVWSQNIWTWAVPPVHTEKSKATLENFKTAACNWNVRFSDSTGTIWKVVLTYLPSHFFFMWIYPSVFACACWKRDPDLRRTTCLNKGLNKWSLFLNFYWPTKVKFQLGTVVWKLNSCFSFLQGFLFLRVQKVKIRTDGSSSHPQKTPLLKRLASAPSRDFVTSHSVARPHVCTLCA